jgi:2-methylcitrate dehydratase
MKMDPITAEITRYVVEQRGSHTNAKALHEATRRVVDSLGCAIAAKDAEPVRIARSLAEEITSTRGASVLGQSATTSVEFAAFTNAAAIRYLDCNDTYFTARGGGGHPSDLIGGALAVAEMVGASGPELLQAITLGYEVNGALASGVWLRERGWDQGLNIIAATAAMAGSLLGLDRARLGHAIALAVTPNVPVRQTRIGALSMWKGLATAGAIRNGVFAALLAERGITGPAEPYAGRSGLWELVTGEFDLALPVHPGHAVIEDTSLKMRPAEFNAQAAIDIAISLHRDVALDDVASIDIGTYWLAWHEIGMDRDKWDPRNRETADHSLPYLFAVALADGRVDSESCGPERLADPALRAVLPRITVAERAEFTAAFPREFNVAVAITLKNGEVVERHARVPHGHPDDPASDAELDAKYDFMTQGLTGDDRGIAASIRSVAWKLGDAANLNELTGLLRSISTSPEERTS